jgi:hypothetical protein
MNFEDFQKVWRCQTDSPRAPLDADALLKGVRRKEQQFRRTLFFRDVIVAGITFLLIPVLLYSGIRAHEVWSYYLLPLGCLFVGVFRVVDRQIQRRKQPSANETLKSCAEASLAQVSHEIWLSKNIVWWILLPITAPEVINSIRDTRHTPERLAIDGGCVVFCVLVAWAAYHLTGSNVRKDLKPRRQELERLLSGLNQ